MKTVKRYFEDRPIDEINNDAVRTSTSGSEDQGEFFYDSAVLEYHFASLYQAFSVLLHDYAQN